MELQKIKMFDDEYLYIDCLNKKEILLYLKKCLCYLSNSLNQNEIKGIIFVMNSKTADLKISLFNKEKMENISDEVLKEILKNLYNQKIIEKENIDIETSSGIKKIQCLHDYNVKRPNFSVRSIPIMTDKSVFLNEKINVLGDEYIVSCLNVDKPYMIVFFENIDNLDLENIGFYFENYRQFPQGVNVIFSEIIDQKEIKIRIWEKGKGEIYHSDSAVCASVVANLLTPNFSRNQEISVLTKEKESRVVFLNNDYIEIKNQEKCKKYMK